MTIYILFLTIIAVVIHVLLTKKRTPKKIIEIILLYLLVLNLGFGGIVAFAFHAFNADATAKMIGWAPGSPFQYEVAVSDLSHGVLGLLCIWFRGPFWLATMIVNGVFLIGCMVGHVRDAVLAGNTAQYNIGINIIFSDLILPVFIFGLYLYYSRMKK